MESGTIFPVATALTLNLHPKDPVLTHAIDDSAFQAAHAVPSRKDMLLKPQERKEKWERQPGKKPRESDRCVSAEPGENGHNNDAGSSGRETDRGKERVKKKVPLKVHKQVYFHMFQTPVEVIVEAFSVTILLKLVAEGPLNFRKAKLHFDAP
ncbi:Fibrosin-1-like protein [Varanus komodoensis]|nr:Fibrosin-1-like protein [Varanus komodoensis]